MSSAAGTSIGSGRMRVMPAAAAATSVPVARAMPKSAAAKAAASFTPSPTMATPPCWRRAATIAALSSGRASARTSSIPTAWATAAAASWRSPLSITTWRPDARRAATASAARPNGVSEREHAHHLPGGGQEGDRPALRHQRPRRVCQGLDVHALLRHQPLAAEQHRAAGHQRADTPARQRTDLLGRGGRAGAGQHGARQRMLAAGLHGGGQLQHRRLRRARGGVDGQQRRPAAVRVPVLSKTTVFTAPARSNTSASRIRMPCRAAAPVPTMIAAGVARPSAHGQAITSTATAFTSAVSAPARPATSRRRSARRWRSPPERTRR